MMNNFFIDPRKLTPEQIKKMQEDAIWMWTDFFKQAWPTILFTIGLTCVLALIGFLVR